MVYKYYSAVQQGKARTFSTSLAETLPLNPNAVKKQFFFVKYRTSLFFSGYVIFYATFLLSGAAIFNFLETPAEQALIHRLRTTRSNFLAAHPSVSDEALEALINEVVHASNRGVSAVQNVSGEPNWSFGQSLFFSSTVITTIGYGHVTPLSRTGKMFCIIYAITGIPLTLVLLSALVERLLVPSIWFLQFLNSKLGHIYEPFQIRLLHLSVIGFLLLIFFMLIPAAIFAAFEPEWDYLDSFYYCFISLTTIGLGDYIPGDAPAQPHRPIYKIATTAYLFLGITFMMLTLTIFYDIPQLNIGILFTTTDEVSPDKVLLTGPSQTTQYGAGNVFESKYDENTHRHVVRVRSRRDDSPSPDEPSKDITTLP